MELIKSLQKSEPAETAKKIKQADNFIVTAKNKKIFETQIDIGRRRHASRRRTKGDRRKSPRHRVERHI